MKIYVAHSKHDEILDPDTLKYEPEDTYAEFLYNMVHTCYPAIECCDAVVAVPDAKTGKLTTGVRMEVEYARDHGIKVLCAEIPENTRKCMG